MVFLLDFCVRDIDGPVEKNMAGSKANVAGQADKIAGQEANEAVKEDIFTVESNSEFLHHFVQILEWLAVFFYDFHWSYGVQSSC